MWGLSPVASSYVVRATFTVYMNAHSMVLFTDALRIQAVYIDALRIQAVYNCVVYLLLCEKYTLTDKSILCVFAHLAARREILWVKVWILLRLLLS